MIPKKSSALYKEVAEELNLPADLIEDFIEFYYKEIKANVTGLIHPRINVECLGQFVIRPVAVRKAIPRYKKALEKHDTSTFNAYHNKVLVEKKLAALEHMEKELSKADLKKEEIKQKKIDYYEKYPKTDLEQPETDN
jgi:hypothetical protein